MLSCWMRTFQRFLRRGAMVAPGGQLDFPRDALVLRIQGATIPLRVNSTGRYFLSVPDSGKDAWAEVRGPVASGPSLISVRTSPIGGSYQFDPPRTFSACKAGTLRGPVGRLRFGPQEDCHGVACELGPRGGATNWNGFWRIRIEITCIRPLAWLRHRKAPHIPTAGASAVATLNEKLRATLLCLDDIIAPHAMDVYSKYSLPIPVRPKSTPDVCNS